MFCGIKQPRLLELARNSSVRVAGIHDNILLVGLGGLSMVGWQPTILPHLQLNRKRQKLCEPCVCAMSCGHGY